MDAVHTLEEHLEPHEKCQQCGLQLPPHRLNAAHCASDQCQLGAARLNQRAAQQESFEASQVAFQLCDATLTQVNQHKCLGRPITHNNSDWPALCGNLLKAQQRWAMVARVLIHAGVPTKAKGMLCKAVVQALLLCGCETWAVTPTMMWVLESFHHEVAQRIAGKLARRTTT